MATGGQNLKEVRSDLDELQLPPGMCGGQSSPVQSGHSGGEGPSFKEPPRSGGMGSKRKGSSKTHSEE
jgi:hypothetical protein